MLDLINGQSGGNIMKSCDGLRIRNEIGVVNLNKKIMRISKMTNKPFTDLFV
jgi:hypothetical protein